jgi:FO synthase subunit 1
MVRIHLPVKSTVPFDTMPRALTFSRNVFLPLTTVCRNRYHYCGYKTPVIEGCLMSPDQVREILRAGKATGCTEALFTFGERPGLVEGFSDHLARIGYSDILTYTYDLCREAIGLGLLPHLNAGVLTYDEMKWLAEVNASMGLMLETTALVRAHEGSPGKDPGVRVAMIEDAGRLQIPFTTGILLGIGETMEDRVASLHTIRDLHARFGHIQEVIIQNFCPKSGTLMGDIPGVSIEEISRTVRFAREILPSEVAVQVPPNLLDAARVIACGADDLGGISPVTDDYINPEHPWPSFDQIRAIRGDATLVERLCIYPRFIAMRWYHPALEPLITRLDQDLMVRNRMPVSGPARYCGKAKSLFPSERHGELLVLFRDEITAFDGGKSDTLQGKGSWNAKVSAFFFRLLEERGIRTHFIGMEDDVTMRVRELAMIPLEVIVRNIAAGSMVRNYPIAEGTPLDHPVIVIDYKDDSRHDPMINDELIIALRILNPAELATVKSYALAVNEVLRDYLLSRGIDLVDFKLEFGRADGQVLVGDEISMDSMRLWDRTTRESLDKDVYRFSKGDVMEVYASVAARILGCGGAHEI